MVKVVVTGANSGLALEVIDALAEGKHEVLALARRVSTPGKHNNFTIYSAVFYN